MQGKYDAIAKRRLGVDSLLSQTSNKISYRLFNVQLTTKFSTTMDVGGQYGIAKPLR